MSRIGLPMLLGAFALSCASARPTSKTGAAEGLDGTWINDSGDFPARIVNSGEHFQYQGKTAWAYWEGTREIVSRWTDDSGNRWYKTYETADSNRCGAGAYGFVCSPVGAKWQLLQKVSADGKTLEFVFVRVENFDAASFPSRIDPDLSDLSLAASHRVLQRVP